MKTMKTMSMGLLGLTLAALMGCGSSVSEESHAAAGSGGSGGSGSGGHTSASSGTGGACAAFADQEGVAKVTLHVKNQSPMAIYMPGLCSGIDYTIRPEAGSDGTSYTFDGSCLQTCEGLQTEPPFLCDACAPSSYVIPAGGSRDIVWEGTGLRTADMPAACWFQPGSTVGGCGQIFAAPSGSYRVEATGYAQCLGADDGGCECNADGQCFGPPSGQQAWVSPVTFDFPGAAEVDVVFDTCAFGCPNGED
jgi:hypothetical protein